MKRIVKKRERINSETKSKQRIRDIGEVTTGEREINAMLDFVKPLSYKIETTFLEPTAGDGNFLVIILERKLQTIKKNYKKDKSIDRLKLSLIALSKIYAVELKKDNVLTSKKRLYNVMMHFLEKIITFENGNHIYNELNTNNVINWILDKNVIEGDFLKKTNKNKQSIYFYAYDWSNYPHNIKLTKIKNALMTLNDHISKKMSDTIKLVKDNLLTMSAHKENKRIVETYCLNVKELTIMKTKKENYEGE